MEVVIEGTNEWINLNGLEKIGSGKDGQIFKYKDKVIKICESGYMTSNIFFDIRDALSKAKSEGLDTSSLSMILPEKTVDSPYNPIKRLKVTPLFGYTQKYILPMDSIVDLSTGDFISECEKMHKNLHAIFSSNSIALTDTNPNNILYGKDRKLYLIDFDRCITQNCMESEKQCIKSGDYYLHNESRFSQIIYKYLLLQALLYISKKKEFQSDVSKAIDNEIKKGYTIEEIMQSVNSSIGQNANKIKSLDDTYHMLDKFESVDKYAKDKALKLIRQKK